MFGRKRNEPQNIRKSGVTRKIKIGNKEVTIKLNYAFVGTRNGRDELMDEVLVRNMLNQIGASIKANSSSYNPIPDKITFDLGTTQTAEGTGEQETPDVTDGQSEIIESYEPRFQLEQVALNEDTKRQIEIAISSVRHKKKLVEDWGLSEQFSGNRATILNFYGKPGTGKSMTAEAIASALGKKVYRINYSDLESKYVGETPKNIKKAFSIARKDDAVLIFDEADSFLGKRLTSVSQSADYGVNITRSVLLMELEKFDGVVIFTTNLIKNYDEAFKRRIFLSVYFEMPDAKARKKIWALHLGSRMPLGDKINPSLLSEKYTDLSGADIKDMVFFAALYALEENKDYVDTSAFDYAYKAIRDRYTDKDAMSEVKIISRERITEEQYKKEAGLEES